MEKNKLIAIFFMVYVAALPPAKAALDAKRAASYAELSLKCAEQTFPYKFDHVVENRDDVKTQQIFHPIFYGCFDWHSAVHGHWALVKLLSAFPDFPLKDKIEKTLDEHFQPAKVAAEKAYLERDDDTKRFERPYGYGWFLRLMTELRKSANPKAAQWVHNLEPLEKTVRNRLLDYLKVFDYPIRRGVHENSAFALIHGYDYARLVNDDELLKQLNQTARKFYFSDTKCPTSYEPEGDDFISPCLTEGDLMRRVLSPQEFSKWFNKFWPQNKLNFFEPLVPTNIHDAKAVHLVGLDFEKAWTMAGIAAHLPMTDPRRKIFLESSRRHAETGAKLMEEGGYEGTHWLASFAIFQATDTDLNP